MKKGTTAIVAALLGAVSGTVPVFTSMNKKINGWKALNGKNDKILQVYSQWLSLKQEGKSLSEYFQVNGYQKIAIYGMHYLGESLCGELQNTDIEIKYAIDKKADDICCDIDIYKPDEQLTSLDEVDAVVVTAFFFYNEIEEQLSQYLDCPIISLEDILYEI